MSPISYIPEYTGNHNPDELYGWSVLEEDPEERHADELQYAVYGAQMKLLDALEQDVEDWEDITATDRHHSRDFFQEVIQARRWLLMEDNA